MEYLIALIFCVLCIYGNKRMTKATRCFCLTILCAYVIILMGLRYRVGIDTINYLSGYYPKIGQDYFKSFDILTNIREPGYYFVCYLCSFISDQFWVVQLLCASITNFCIFLFLYRNCTNPFIGIAVYFFLYFFYFTAEIMRESAAIGIFLLNYQNLKEGKWVRYYLFTFFSIFFHYSALITWLFPLVKFLKVNALYFIIIGLMLAVTPLVEDFISVIQVASLTTRLDAHLDSAESLNMNWRIAQVIQTVVPSIVVLWICRRKNNSIEIRPFVLLHIIFCAGAFAIPIIFSRFQNYTSLFVVAYIANMYALPKIRAIMKRIFSTVLISSQIIYYAHTYMQWIPYKSIFSMEKVEKREQRWYDVFGQ